jgi:uncharacterized protein YaeQ
MALPSTLYRFKISLSDSDRNIYETVELRVPMHPSETDRRLLARVLAYLLNFQEGIEMMPGIDEPDHPSIRVMDPTGRIRLWVDVGTPAPKRLHKASKSSDEVRCYFFKDPRVYLSEFSKEGVHRSAEIGFFAFEPEMLQSLASTLERDNDWQVTVSGGTLYIHAGGTDVNGEVTRRSLS